jgi:hypothetical protein
LAWFSEHPRMLALMRPWMTPSSRVRSNGERLDTPSRASLSLGTMAEAWLGWQYAAEPRK